MSKQRTLAAILDIGIIPIVRAETPEAALKAAEAIYRGGIRAVEITMTVPGALRVLEKVADQFGDRITLGAGTVLDPETARIAILAGAQYVVGPSLRIDAAKLCNRYQIPYMPGAGSVREIIEAMECGADIIKVFPGETLGPAFVKAVRGPLPHVSLMPTGGVSIENAGEWIQSGCVALGVGGNLTGGASRGDFRSITELARRFIEEIRQARS